MMDRLISKNQIIKAEGGEGTLKPRKPNATYKDEIDWLNGNNEDDSVVHGGFICSSIPSEYKHKVNAHEGGCGSILFNYDSDKLITRGKDGTINMWDTKTMTLSNTLFACCGSINDLAITHDNHSVIAASGSNLYWFGVGSGRDPSYTKGAHR
ncbi:autophagy-related protein 16-like isoform X2 [Magnolia sinica]|uniref:autophagy-related protein 16-like isoform X2 n=1 Tax=Magnolia sinica TaxID=86752 RepID=UPI002659C55A|nr:autophagy-related protein 16-like isoform X2 [Magnolia sinica]